MFLVQGRAAAALQVCNEGSRPRSAGGNRSASVVGLSAVLKKVLARNREYLVSGMCVG